MYSTCLHCHQRLGKNEAIEHFQVGRRLAFDSEKGRLWVVCSHCGRWNLTPIEERWEAVEECERLFRDERLRAQTDQIGLTKIREGTELIRIGKPLRPEFAAWRYGGVFRRRMMKRIGITTGVGASLIAGASLAEGTALAVALAPLALLPAAAWLSFRVRERIRRGTIGTHVIGEDGKALDVTRGNLNHTKIVPRDDGTFVLSLRHLYGRHAARTLGPRASIGSAAGDRPPDEGVFKNMPPHNPGALHHLPGVYRLALEMSLHERSEQFALQQDLALLERDWREAEEIAAIADRLL